MGECSKDVSFAILDTFFDHGGNFIDTYVQKLSTDSFDERQAYAP